MKHNFVPPLKYALGEAAPPPLMLSTPLITGAYVEAVLSVPASKCLSDLTNFPSMRNDPKGFEGEGV